MEESTQSQAAGNEAGGGGKNAAELLYFEKLVGSAGHTENGDAG